MAAGAVGPFYLGQPAFQSRLHPTSGHALPRAGAAPGSGDNTAESPDLEIAPWRGALVLGTAGSLSHVSRARPQLKLQIGQRHQPVGSVHPCAVCDHRGKSGGPSAALKTCLSPGAAVTAEAGQGPGREGPGASGPGAVGFREKGEKAGPPGNVGSGRVTARGDPGRGASQSTNH